MITVHTVADLRAAVRDWRAAGDHIAFVPTMGNLHAGHLDLIGCAGLRAGRVIASIFVNPMQFAPGGDYDRYPRTLPADSAALASAGCDLLFAPSVAEMYPAGFDQCTRVEVPGLSDILCGAHRPGHFVGVATVVAKLFNQVQPDVALFGEKDYQQLLVIRRMVADLCLPVEIVGVPTVREADGLAMSSRNGYLTPDERARAPVVYRALTEAARRLQAGADIKAAEAEGRALLEAAGLKPDYLEVRRADNLEKPQQTDLDLVILTAAWLGSARLIDNLAIGLKPARA